MFLVCFYLSRDTEIWKYEDIKIIRNIIYNKLQYQDTIKVYKYQKAKYSQKAKQKSKKAKLVEY